MVRRYFLLLVLAALFASRAEAADCTLKNTTPTANGTRFVMLNGASVASTSAVSSDCLDLQLYAFFGAQYQCSSTAGSVDVAVVWQQSMERDTALFSTVETLAANLTAETLQAPVTISTPPSKYGRFLLTGQGSNNADTVCTVKLFAQGFPR